MAASVLSRCGLGATKKIKQLWSPMTLNARFALYPDWYLTPMTDEAEIKKLEEEGKMDALKLIPVKPAPVDLSVSVFDDPELKKFTNMVMTWCERHLARDLVQETFGKIKRIQLAKYHAASEEEKKDIVTNPRTIFHQAIENCKPVLNLTPIKKGGITYQVPVPITKNRAQFMSIKWLIMAARDKPGEIIFTDQLTKELLNAFHGEGRVIKRKQDLHKICEANKAYAHYRWS